MNFQQVALYFATFIVFGTMIILNLFIGIIMNSMAKRSTNAKPARPHWTTNLNHSNAS